MKRIGYKSIENDAGKTVKASLPVIVSASRATDIPAFYGNWFKERLKKGFVQRLNPFSRAPEYVSFEQTRVFIFWSKNPKPFFKHLDYLDDAGYNYYFQFTLTDYPNNIEPNIPALEKRIDTFRELSERVGAGRVLWRFDPYVLGDSISVDDLLRKTEFIGNKLKDYTKKLIFSFIDIYAYKKVMRNLRSFGLREFNETQMRVLVLGLSELNRNFNFELLTCAEENKFEQYGIRANKCIDDELMVEEFSGDDALMKYLGLDGQLDLFSGSEERKTEYKKLKDPSARDACKCIWAKDIGQYETCIHGCVYCYAVNSGERAKENLAKHRRYNFVPERILL